MKIAIVALCIIGVIVGVRATLPAGELPWPLRECPALPDGAHYVIAEYDSVTSRFYWIAAEEYDWVTIGVGQTSSAYSAPVGRGVWVGGPEGYWVWGVASNETSDRWHRVTGMRFASRVLAIYDHTQAPFWHGYGDMEAGSEEVAG